MLIDIIKLEKLHAVYLKLYMLKLENSKNEIVY